jgi:hypothetical protein
MIFISFIIVGVTCHNDELSNFVLNCENCKYFPALLNNNKNRRDDGRFEKECKTIAKNMAKIWIACIIYVKMIVE